MVLILKRIPERNCYWQQISGGIEKGENPIDTIKRQIYEETGIIEFERIIDLDCTFTFETKWYGKLTKMREFCYATKIEEEKTIKLNNEHEDYKWCTENEAKKFLKWEHTLIAFDKLINLLKKE